jgi:hypothetical protein
MNLNACYLHAITQPEDFNIIPIELILDDIKSGKYARIIEKLPNSATNDYVLYVVIRKYISMLTQRLIQQCTLAVVLETCSVI